MKRKKTARWLTSTALLSLFPLLTLSPQETPTLWAQEPQAINGSTDAIEHEVLLLDAARIEDMKPAMKQWVLYADVFDVFDKPETHLEIPEDRLFDEPLVLLRNCMSSILQPSVFSHGVSADTVPIVGIQKPGGIQKLRAESARQGQTILIEGGYNQISIGVRIDRQRLFQTSPFGGGDTEGFFRSLRHLVTWPAIPASGFEFSGHTTVVAGVPVHTGRIEQKVRREPPAWYENIYVFVTDSIPQYAYLTFGLCAPEPDPATFAATPPQLFDPPPMPPTEADLDPDVAKRPGFRHALAKKRIGVPFSEFEHQRSLGRVLAPDAIPVGAKATLRHRWEIVVAPAFLPAREAAIQWRGRDEYPTAPEQNTLAARWMTPTGTLTAKGAPLGPGIGLCLRLSGDERITFRFRTESEVNGDRPEDVAPQDILDKPRLLEMLTTYFRFPFEAVADFQIVTGPSGVYDGVPVFSGSIRWDRALAEVRPDAVMLGRESESTGYNEARLFITESEPQYFCIGVSTDGPS